MERPRLSLLVPTETASYRGPRFVLYFLAAYNAVGTVRSLIHVCAPDSGARTIATMDVHGKSGRNVVAMLGQWGGAQLLMAGLIWIVLWRYRGLAPLMIAAVWPSRCCAWSSASSSRSSAPALRQARLAGCCCLSPCSSWCSPSSRARVRSVAGPARPLH